MGRCNVVPGMVFSLLFVFGPTTIAAQFAREAGSSLSGTVFAEGGNQRVENASVVLCDGQGNRLQETHSNNGGEFSFRGIPATNYLLQVRAEGFEPVDLHFDLNLNSARGVSINLRAARKTEAAAPDRPTISAHELSMPEAAREWVTSGRRKLYQEKNAPGALGDFQSATSKAPNYYEAHYLTGMAYLALRREEDAEKAFRKSVELSGRKFGDADIALGTLLLRKEENSEGESFLRQGLLLNPHSWPGQVELGKLELSRGHLEQARAAAEKAESLAPQQPMVYRLLGLVHLKAKNYAALMCDLDNYIRLDPDSATGARAKEMRLEIGRQLPTPIAESCSGR